MPGTLRMMSPRRRAPPLSPREEAEAEARELLALRAKLGAVGIGPLRIERLLVVASMRGGVSAVEKVVSRSRALRRRGRAQLIEQQCGAHADVHELFDDPLDIGCHPKKSVTCSSKVQIVRNHFWFCRALMHASIAPPAKRPTGPGPRPKRLLVVPGNARTPGDVIRFLGDAGLNQHEIALLWLDHERRKRKPGVPLTKDAIEMKHHVVRTAAYAQRRKQKAIK